MSCVKKEKNTIRPVGKHGHSFVLFFGRGCHPWLPPYGCKGGTPAQGWHGIVRGHDNRPLQELYAPDPSTPVAPVWGDRCTLWLIFWGNWILWVSRLVGSDVTRRYLVSFLPYFSLGHYRSVLYVCSEEHCSISFPFLSDCIIYNFFAVTDGVGFFYKF